MKKKIYTLALVFALASINVMAQDEPPRDNNNKKFSFKEMIEKNTDSMAEQYGLNKKQTKKLKKLNEKYENMMGPMGGQPPMGPPPGDNKAPNGQQQQPNRQNQQQPNGQQQQPNGKQFGQRRQGNQNMDERRNSYNKELKEIMTTDQYNKYMTDQNNRQRQRPSHPDDRK